MFALWADAPSDSLLPLSGAGRRLPHLPAEELEAARSDSIFLLLPHLLITVNLQCNPFLHQP